MLTPIITNPRKSLNKAFLKLKPNRTEIESFKSKLSKLFDGINENESEEFHKNLVADFLKGTYYGAEHFINTKGRNDLVIHTGKDAKTNVGVIIEAKSPANKTEMLKKNNINLKAFHKLILYYLRERISANNIEVKHLIATNIYEWFIFDSRDFDKLFAQNKKLIKQFSDFEEKRLASTDTAFFYKEIAEKFVVSLETDISFTYFDLRDYEKPLKNLDKKDDNILIALYKLLSPQHLLKQAFLNDSNSLDKTFYSELLHIIGLEETKEGSKKLIGRKTINRNSGSLLENTIIQLDTLDKISRIANPSQFGNNYNERLYNVSLELVITWINRILFLKLLEAQLVTYHKGDKNFEFLNIRKIKDFDELNSLFFRVLARKTDERSEDVAKAFSTVPYLNSSLFEPTELEQLTVFINCLRTESKIPILSNTVLKDATGKKRSGELNPLEYIFEFLNAYDFSSEGSEEIQEDNKTLINASVLGLIFEKINGYKDGSFFTPGFITMYMCRETIRRAVLQKFKEAKNWDCENLGQLYNKIDDKPEANRIINSLKICDPAVGSGHFLVSALNEIIAIKSELKILCDDNEKTLRDYTIEVVNDELAVSDEDGKPFTYNPANAESRRVQETLFREKQTIIENCLFGVDINPNSVKICRLRLWIELLKNAYYKAPDFKELETLPNIDINIKCGNSLISRYTLDSNIKDALKKSKWSVDSYRIAVMSYRNAQSKEEKRSMEQLIGMIKSDFESEVAVTDKRVIRLRKLKGDLHNLTTQTTLFERNKAELAAWNKQVKTLTTDIQKLETELDEIKSNKIYENAFEWRFEFPEVLNDEGDFVGFDVVIGNPPYGRYLELSDSFKTSLVDRGLSANTGDIAESFIRLALNNLFHSSGILSFIIPKGLSYVKSWESIRSILLEKFNLLEILDTSKSFKEVAYEMMIFVLDQKNDTKLYTGSLNEDSTYKFSIKKTLLNSDIFYFGFPIEYLSILEKVKTKSSPVSNYFECWYGKGGMTPLVNMDCKGIKVLTGKEIQRYFQKDISDKWYISEELITEDLHKRVNIVKVVAQDIVAHIQNPRPHIKLTATMDYSNQFCLNTVMCFSSISNLSNEFLLALINSKFLSFYYYYFIFNQAIRTMHFMPGYSDILPIPDNAISFNEKISNLVMDILKTKESEPTTDTSALESEIDHMVYELYGLTEEEIKIVEGRNE